MRDRVWVSQTSQGSFQWATETLRENFRGRTLDSACSSVKAMSRYETSTTPLSRQRLSSQEHYTLARGMHAIYFHPSAPKQHTSQHPSAIALSSCCQVSCGAALTWRSFLFLLGAAALWQGGWWRCWDKSNICLQHLAYSKCVGNWTVTGNHM